MGTIGEARIASLMRRTLAERWLPAWVDPDPEGHAFDARHGTETRWFDLGNYEPSPPSVVGEALAGLPIEGRTFVDLGSGKGRVVLLASRWPFARVVGVERRRRLHAIAERNRGLYEASAGRGAPIVFSRGDVTDHPLPDGPLLLWMFNPFGPEVIDAVCRRVAAQDVWWVYAWPKYTIVLQAHGFRVDRSGGAEDCPWQVLHR